jgi:hypothetical protein
MKFFVLEMVFSVFLTAVICFVKAKHKDNAPNRAEKSLCGGNRG